MVEFGPNGSVIGAPAAKAPDASSGYTVETQAKIRRIGLASALCGVGACFLVALIGVILIFLGVQTADLFGQDADLIFGTSGFLQGIGMAVLMSAMNWYFGYFTIPGAALALGFSIGRFPRRGITDPAPYYRWGAIWGAILVGGTTSIASAFIPSEGEFMVIVGAAVGGALIGATAGFICGAIFRGIVRPAEQVQRIQVDVF